VVDAKKLYGILRGIRTFLKGLTLATIEWFSDPVKRYSTLLGVCFVVSVVVFSVYSAGHVERVFFFPTIEGKNMASESRAIPRRWGTENQVELYVREMILGPMALSEFSLLPPDTKVNSVLVRKGTAYVDISSDFLVSGSADSLPFPDIFSYVKKSISFNFRSIRRVELTLDGNLPYASLPSDDGQNLQEKKKKR
jgi:hypothetical protein